MHVHHTSWFFLCALCGLFFLQFGVIASDDAQSPSSSSPSSSSATGTLRQIAYLKASNPDGSDHFACGGALDGHAGNGVAISGDGNTIAIGAPHESGGARGINGNQNDNSLYSSGAVYVFTRNGATSINSAGAPPPGEAAVGEQFANGDQFGFSLALSDDGNTIAVGAISEDSASAGVGSAQTDNSQISVGAVYVFRRTGNAWSQQAYVKPANPDGGDLFGYAVSLSADGNTLAVGSYDEDGSARQVNGTPDNARGGAGAVYIFTRAGSGWNQQAYIKALNAEQGDSFGVSVSLSDDGNTLLSGSLDEDCLSTGVNAPGSDAERESNTSAGAAYVFVRNGTTWAQQAYLKPSQTGIEDWFGARLALNRDGRTMVVGAHGEDSAAKASTATRPTTQPTRRERHTCLRTTRKFKLER